MIGATAAVSSSGLLDRLTAPAHLRRAWRQVRSNRGLPGGDGVTVQQFERGLDANLAALAREARTGTYQPGPLRHLQIRTGTKIRRLAIPPVRDRVLQRAALNLLEPLGERHFTPGSFGYRPGRGVPDAVEAIARGRAEGLVWVLDADIKDCFDSLDHAVLRRCVRAFVPDARVCALLEAWIEQPPVAGVTGRGVPLGAVISPFFCNLYLHHLDQALHRRDLRAVRYADDFVVLCRSRTQAIATRERTGAILREIKLELNGDKTKVVSFDQGFTFLGVRFDRDGATYLWPYGPDPYVLA